ncbi:MAG: hypothetical protein RRZ67_00265 [Victivallaceae bacterium]
MDMSLSEMSYRALKRVFNKSRFFLIFFGLCGFGIVFLSLLSFLNRSHVGFTMQVMSTGSFFLSFSFVFAVGIIVTNLLALEDSLEKETLLKVLSKQWKKLWNSLMISVPFFLIFAFMVILVMMSVFLSMLPVLGRVFHVALTFLPFISAAVVQCLFWGSFVSLFLFVPIFSLKNGIDYFDLLKMTKKNLFMKAIGFLIAFAPLFVSFKFIRSSLNFMSDLYFLAPNDSWEGFIQVLILVAPVSLLLTPSISFFFNFSYEFNSEELNREVQDQHN